MTAIAIDRFHARYRLAPRAGDAADAAGQLERLQRILAQVIDSGLDAAVQRSGIDRRGELCIREVNALARLGLGESDAALAAKLALAIAGAIESGARERGAEVVRYGSRAHALIDLAVAAVRGDLTRSWAWRSLGLWDAELTVAAASTAGAVRSVLRALTAEPRHATAALARLACDQALFARLLERGSPAEWRDLSRAVLRVTGADAELSPGEAAAPVSARTETARRVVRRSVIARAALAAGNTGWVADARRQALAVLAVCETEPAVLQAAGATARAVVHAAAAELAERTERAGLPDQERLARGSADASTPALPSSLAVPASGSAVRGPAGVEKGKGRRARREEPAHQPSPARRDGRPGLQPASVRRDPPGPGTGEPAASAEPLPEVRRRAPTRFGGLLFLIHLADRLGLAERIVREPGLAERSPRWCLHQLAMALVAAPAADPAVLAFAGLLPGSEPPADDQPAPTAREAASIAGLRLELLLLLRRRLDRPRDPEPALLDLVCRRSAEIVADPGWLEAHLSLDDVRTDIRAAGLDLDPGWVPWLGLVVRFVYA
jgi:hypothetical protein